MSGHSVNASDSGAFSFGVAELAQAARREPVASSPITMKPPPKLREIAVSGFDPYNSTGGFDRKNAWNRIRKR